MNALERIAALADVPISIEVELDRRILPIREILALEVGSVICTARSAGENIDVFLAGVSAAFGEIVVIENTIGVRITSFHDED